MSSDEDLLEFSGAVPEDTRLLTDSDPDVLVNFTSDPTLLLSTTSAPYLPYSPNLWRISFLAFKCLLILLVSTVSCTIRRDFLRVFVFCLLVPLFLEAAFDVFTEIHATTAIFGVTSFDWRFFNPSPPVNSTVSDWQKIAIQTYGSILQKYTTYRLYKSDEIFELCSFVLSDLVFWSLLFSTSTAFFYAHRAIVRPEQIAYEPFTCAFIKIQILPFLFTTVDTLLSYFETPWYVYLGTLFLIRISALLLVVTIATQIFGSLILFCRSTDEFTITSPYEQIRNGKCRLFLLIIFTIVIHSLSLPYIIWSAISLADDFLRLLDISASLPLHLATELFPLHLSFFILRPFVFLLSVLVFINPFRRRFVRFFCPCCKRK